MAFAIVSLARNCMSVFSDCDSSSVRIPGAVGCIDEPEDKSSKSFSFRVRKKDGGRWRAGRHATSVALQVDRFKLTQDIEKLARREARLLPEALVEALKNRVRAGEVEKAWNIFELLRGQEWYVPQQAQYLSLLKLLAERKQCHLASELRVAMEKDKLPPSVEIYTAIINAYVKSERLKDAYEVFEQMKSISYCFPDVYTYTILIEGFLHANEIDRASLLMDEMKENEIHQNTVTWNTLLASFGKLGKFQLIEEAVSIMSTRPESFPDIYSWNIVLKSYGKLGRVRDMEKWYSRMQDMEVSPDMITFNTLIHVYGRNREFSKMRNVAKHMLGMYFQWDDVTFNSMIEAYGRAGMIEEMEESYRIMKSKGLKPSPFTMTTLVNTYSKQGQFDKVEKIRREWKNSDIRADVIMYNSLLEACRRAGNLVMMEETFKELENLLQPDRTSYDILAHAYRSKGMREKYNEVMAKLKSIPRKPPPSWFKPPNLLERRKIIDN